MRVRDRRAHAPKLLELFSAMTPGRDATWWVVIPVTLGLLVFLALVLL